MAVIGIVAIIGSVANSISEVKSQPVPGTVVDNLRANSTYDIWGSSAPIPSSTGQSGGTTSVSLGGFVLSQDQVRVTGPNGELIPTSQLSGNSTTTNANQQYMDSLRFSTLEAGNYTIEVRGRPNAGERFLVTPSIATAVKAAIRWVWLIGASIIVWLVSLVWFIVALVRRSHWKRTNA